MSPAELALLECIEIPFDILKIVDSGENARPKAIEALTKCDGRHSTSFLIEKIKLY